MINTLVVAYVFTFTVLVWVVSYIYCDGIVFSVCLRMQRVGTNLCRCSKFDLSWLYSWLRIVKWVPDHFRMFWTLVEGGMDYC